VTKVDEPPTVGQTRLAAQKASKAAKIKEPKAAAKATKKASSKA
jgi:hypothetical protein